MATFNANDRLGLSTTPEAEGKRDGFAGDESLRIFAHFLKAWINKYTKNLWRKLHGPGARGPVLEVFGDDPYEGVCDEDLPALYVYRQIYTAGGYALASDITIFPSQIQIAWIPQRETLEERKIKDAFASTVARQIYMAVEKGRDPSYIHPLDTDPGSQFEGTFIYGEKFMNPFSIKVREGKWSKIDLYIGGEGGMMDTESRTTFPAQFVTVDVEEARERNYDPDNDPYDPSISGSLDVRVSNDDGATYPEILRRIV